MTIKEIINVCADTAALITGTTFNHLQEFNIDLYGTTDEWPKIVLLKPVSKLDTVNQPYQTIATINLWFLDHSDANTSDDLGEDQDNDLDIVDAQESLANTFITLLKQNESVLKVNSIEFLSTHREFSNNISGVLLTLNVTFRYSTCN